VEKKREKNNDFENDLIDEAAGCIFSIMIIAILAIIIINITKLMS
jgi:hypothetical protein